MKETQCSRPRVWVDKSSSSSSSSATSAAYPLKLARPIARDGRSSLGSSQQPAAAASSSKPQLLCPRLRLLQP
eukprot:scaffold49440_cov58-Phaeocystis_antarctica.AAC.5